jgi:hypothetical protein
MPRLVPVPCLLATLLVILLAAPLAAASDLSPAAERSASPHVAESHGSYYLADRKGRQILLRGINSNALVEYPDYFQQTVPLRRADVEEMAALGFNFLRLPINWSLLEPAPGAYSRDYLRRIDRIVGWAESEGMWVLVDFHQDRYNRNLRPGDEADGAPDWATLTDGRPCEEGAFFTSPCSIAAYDNFWNNTVVAGKPLQTHYLAAMKKVSRTLRDHRRLLGLELMNEPTFGSTGSPQFEREQLWPFYNRMIDGLRRDGETRMIWFEPNIVRDVIDFDPGQPEPFSDDGNLVYAPHIYTGVFNGGDLDQLRASYAAAAEEAAVYEAPWVDGEWGGGADPAGEERLVANLDLQNDYVIGSGFWMWKQRPGFYDWHTVEPDGSLRQDSMRAQQLSRPHLDAAPGRIVATEWDGHGLVSTVRGKGGTARAWSGTVVRRGGGSLIKRPRVRVRVDGEPVSSRRSPKRFVTDEVALGGYRVSFRIPGGRHEIELLPGSIR